MRRNVHLGALAGLVLLTGCASAPSTSATPPVPERARYLVEDPVDLLPELQAVLHINLRRLRQERDVYERVLGELLGRVDDPAATTQMRGLFERTEVALVGLGPTFDDGAELVVVLRTREPAVTDADGDLVGAPLVPDDRGLRRAALEGVELVLPDDYTAILVTPALRTGVDAILAGHPGRRFRDEPAFAGLAPEVAFGAAPISLIGKVPPGALAGLSAELAPTLRPLVGALETVHSYGGQLDVGETFDLRLFAQGGGEGPISVLSGALMVLKGALVDSGEHPALGQAAAKLAIEARGNVLELRYALTRAELLELLDGLGDDAEAPEGEEI